MRLRCDVCGDEVTREPPWFLGCDAPTGPHFTCSRKPVGTWRKVEPPPATAPVERKPRMSDADRAKDGWERRWKAVDGSGNAASFTGDNGERHDRRFWTRDIATAWCLANNAPIVTWAPVAFWHRIKPKPAAAPPRELCGAHCDAGLTRAVCDRPSGHLGPHSWQRDQAVAFPVVERAIDEATDDLRERLRVAEDALRLAREDKERAERQVDTERLTWEAANNRADDAETRAREATTKLAAAEAERDRLRAERDQCIESVREVSEAMTKASTALANSLPDDAPGLAGRTAPVPHPANVMAAEAISREAAPLQVGDRVMVSYSGRIVGGPYGRSFTVLPDAISGVPQSVHTEALRRLPEPAK